MVFYLWLSGGMDTLDGQSPTYKNILFPFSMAILLNSINKIYKIFLFFFFRIFICLTQAGIQSPFCILGLAVNDFYWSYHKVGCFFDSSDSVEQTHNKCLVTTMTSFFSLFFFTDYNDLTKNSDWTIKKKPIDEFLSADSDDLLSCSSKTCDPQRQIVNNATSISDAGCLKARKRRRI